MHWSHCIFHVAGLLVAFAYDDISYMKVATQSHTVIAKTPTDTYPGNAVDRNTATCTKTRPIGINSPDKTVWWKVDLGGVYSIRSINILFRNYDGYENRQRGRFAGFSLYVSNSGVIQDSTLCYKDGPQLPPLNFTIICAESGRYVIFYNERVGGVVNYPSGYELENAYTELCEVTVQGCYNPSFYGSNCDIPCPNNCKGNMCNIQSGACFTCKTGWTDMNCDKKCIDGWYGLNCSQQCIGHCKDGATCNHVTGHCDRGCAAGWQGDMCNNECNDGTYGYDCVNNCSGHCLSNTSCNKETGHCDKGCNPGYTGGDCRKECLTGYFGLDCKERCSGQCANSYSCDHISGVCHSGCRDGYIGNNCNSSCKEGYFGTNCSQNCSPNCKSDKCRHTDGWCTCDAGLIGDNCTTVLYPIKEVGCTIKFIENMDSETNSHKRKRPEEESDKEKHEKRPRLDNNQKHGEVLRNNDGTSLFEAETPICNEIDDGKLNQFEEEVSDSSISVTGSENDKENAIFINMPAKTEACSLAHIEIEKNDGAHVIDSIARSDSSDDLKDGGVRDFDASCSSTTIYETKNDDESNGRDTQTEDDDLGIESDTEKGDDIKFDNIDHVQKKEDGLDNCVYHQIENNLEEKSYMNKELIYSRELEESEVQIEHRDVLDANLVEHECTNSVSTTESENQIVTSETSGQKDNTIDEERFLYRLLKPGESYNHGIRPKNVNSNTSIDYHVAYGSGDFVESKYISCSKTRSGINRFASFIRRDSRSQLRYIVRIDKTKLGEDCKIYDLTEKSVRTEHLHSDLARRHSLRFDEVLLAPSYEIPVECFTKVATVQDGEKKWNDDA